MGRDSRADSRQRLARSLFSRARLSRACFAASSPICISSVERVVVVPQILHASVSPAALNSVPPHSRHFARMSPTRTSMTHLYLKQPLPHKLEFLRFNF